MTYRELLEKLKTMHSDQLESLVTVYTPEDEYYEAELVFADKNNDVLDINHPYFLVNEDHL